MTKKYLVLKDQIQSTVGTSEFPPSSTAVKTELDKKLAIAQTVGDAGKFMKVNASGNIVPETVDIPSKTSDLTNDSDFTTATAVATSYVPKTTKVAGHALSGDVTIETGDLTESTGFPKVTSEMKTGWDAKISDFKINGTTAVTSGVAALTITDNVTSTSTSAALSANQGKVLKDAIDALSIKGRYLSTWDCTTGLPETQPASELPYTYRSGDYYVVAKVGDANNLIPSGTSYTGAASTTVATDTVAVGDQYFFDGTTWSHIPLVIPALVKDVTVDGSSIVSSGVAAIPTASASAKGLLSSTDYAAFTGKQDAIAAGTAGEVLTYSGTAGTVGAKAIDTAVTKDSTNLVTSGAVFTAVDTLSTTTTTALAGKQDTISASAKVSADYIDDSAATNKFVTAAQKTEWSGKQGQIAAGTAGDVVTYSGTAGTVGSLGFDTAPTASSTNLVKSGAIKTALDAKEDVANRVSSWSSTVSNNKYPTEKLVKDALDRKLSVDQTGTVTAFHIGCDASGYYLEEDS